MGAYFSVNPPNQRSSDRKFPFSKFRTAPLRPSQTKNARKGTADAGQVAGAGG
jgi:hypothetical protein